MAIRLRDADNGVAAGFRPVTSVHVCTYTPKCELFVSALQQYTCMSKILKDYFSHISTPV